MAEIIITIPDAVAVRVLSAFAGTFGWNIEVDGTRAQFAKLQLARYVKTVVIAWEQEQAGRAARTSAVDEVNVT